MPPANSPDSEQPPSFFSALRELESPVNEDVLNLAATLGTPAEHDYDVHHNRSLHNSGDHDSNDHDAYAFAAGLSGPNPISLHHLRPATDYERRRLAQDYDQQHPHRLDRSQDRLRLLERQRDALDQHQRLRRVMSRLSRLSDNTQAYGDRVPSQNSLYDWSPANEADDEDELDQILAELRREQPNTHPEILRVLGQSQLDSERARIRIISNRLQGQSSGASAADSLRSTAILQSVRRHPRFSARTREYLQRYQESTARSAQSSEPREPRERPSDSAARHLPMQRLAESRTSLDRDRRDLLSRPDVYRSSRASTSTPSPTASPMLEHTVRYLSRIRHSNTIDESLNCALDAGFLSKDYFCMQHADFITDTFTIPPPAETSWLAPGAVLSGCQHATSAATTTAVSIPGGSTTLHRFRIVDGATNNSMLPALPPPSRPWVSNLYPSARSPSPQQSIEGLLGTTPPPQQQQQDRWPVKVTVHAVDWERMSLSATMEAYNVPSHPHSHSQPILNSSTPTTHQFTRTSSITTFLEGEIIDFNTHTMLTESFTSNPANDAIYWRKLPPFARMTDDEIVKNLTSRKYLTDVLSKEWVLMRWKERCFVKSLNKSTANSVQPPQSFSTSSFPSHIPDGPYYPSSNDAPTAASTTHFSYRTVQNPSTSRAENETTPSFMPLDDQHATFDDSGYGLTISGFYFVCLRRRDGMVEGLYYDPQSSPYQCLRLASERKMWPAWEFR